ncbi:hypothetical protein [Mycobacteroides chelonae]|uniref:hypothetical protein n=1 Tax=Mycobacteroides chelonae TaxID=1774 RepID=UPI003AAF9A08
MSNISNTRVHNMGSEPSALGHSDVTTISVLVADCVLWFSGNHDADEPARRRSDNNAVGHPQKVRMR